MKAEQLIVPLSALVIGGVLGGAAGYALKPVPEAAEPEVKIVEKKVEVVKEVRAPGPREGGDEARRMRRGPRREQAPAAAGETQKAVQVAAGERPEGPRTVREWADRFNQENPELFAAATNQFAQMRRQRTERAQSRIAFIQSIDTSKMSEADRQHTEALQGLLAQREELEARMSTLDLSNEDLGQLGQEMWQANDAIRQESEAVREILIKQLAEEAGYSGEDVGAFSEYVHNVMDMTSGGGRGFGGFSGMGGRGGMNGMGGGRGGRR